MDIGQEWDEIRRNGKECTFIKTYRMNDDTTFLIKYVSSNGEENLSDDSMVTYAVISRGTLIDYRCSPAKEVDKLYRNIKKDYAKWDDLKTSVVV